MSLILDALKRAESERGGAQAISGLPELSPVPLAQASGNLRWVLMGGVVLLIAGIAGWRFFSAPKTDKTVATVESNQRVIEPAASVPAASKPRAAISEPAKPIIGTEEVASFDEVTGPEEPQQIETPVVPAAPAASTPVSTPEPALPPAAPAVAAPPRNKTPVKLNDTPPAYRASFPALILQVHSWDSNPGARFIRVDGYRYVEGETLPSGLKLVEITENGLILDWQSERVIYPLN